MAVTNNHGAGLVELATADEITFDRPTFVKQIVLTATAAGAFSITIDDAVIVLNVSVNEQTKVIPMDRTVKYLSMTCPAAGAGLVAFLGKG